MLSIDINSHGFVRTHRGFATGGRYFDAARRCWVSRTAATPAAQSTHPRDARGPKHLAADALARGDVRLAASFLAQSRGCSL